MIPRDGVSSEPAVLCVDDEPRVLWALQRALGGEPYQVMRASEAEEALDLLERFPIHVVIADQRMPGMSGAELMAEVRKRRPVVGRMILTGHPVPELAEGNNVLIVKPWDDEQLRETVRQLFAEAAAAQDARNLAGEGG